MVHLTEIYSEGLCAVQEEGGKWGYIDLNGNIVIPFDYLEAKNFVNELAPVKNDENKWGYIDKNGEIVIPFEYTNAEVFSDGVGRVANETEWGELWGYISKDGVMLTGFEYYSPEEFFDGLSVAGKYTGKGYIKKDGTPLTEFCYPFAYSFKNGVAFVEKGELDFDYIDTTGKSIVPSGYEASLHGYSSCDLYPIENTEGKTGYIDNKGNIVIEAIYSGSSGNFINGVAHVYKDEQEYYIDEQENILFYINRNAD